MKATIAAGRTLLLALAAAGAGLAGLATGAQAAAAAPHLTLDPDRGPGGTSVLARGTGFCTSCGSVNLDFGSTVVARGLVVGSDGGFQATFTVPGTAQGGTDPVSALQQGALVTQTAFTVTPSTPAPTQAHPSPVPTVTAPHTTASTTTTTSASSSTSTSSASTTTAATPSSSAATTTAPPTSSTASGQSSGTSSSSSGLSSGAIAAIAIGGLALLAGAGVLVYRRWIA